MAAFVFRTSRYSDYVQSELERGRLRQGWAPAGCSLLDDTGRERSKEDWCQAYVKAWNEEPSPRRHAILRRMLDIDIGDVVLCPNSPTAGQFTIATVSEPYRFEVSAEENDYGHVITVENQRVVSNGYDADSVTISGLFRSAFFRPAVTQVQEDSGEAVFDAAKRLLGSQEDTSSPQDSARIREELFHMGRKTAADSLMKHIANWGFAQFEAAVGDAFERKGYERLGGNITRFGGDADHVFGMPIPGFEEIDLGSLPVLIVQVKHKQGCDPEDADGVQQLVDFKPDSDSGWEVRCRVLFSSADCFTPACHRLAETHNIVLICGTEAGLFLL